MSNDTMWFDREPGSPVAKGTTDPNTLLLSKDKPDWVRLPKEIGGAKARVKYAVTAPCPSCEEEHMVRHLILDLEVAVAECPAKGFLWYTRPR